MSHQINRLRIKSVALALKELNEQVVFVGVGFREDALSRVICRWIFNDMIVDVMPLDDKLWGFTNVWYQRAYPFRQPIDLQGISVYRLPVQYFLLTKWEALKNRDGGVDWRWSQDFEDIVKIMVGANQ